MKAESGKQYSHYKHPELLYTILVIGRLEADPKIECVVYRAEYDSPDFKKGTVWIRPRAMFEENVEHEGKLVPRFSVVE